MVLCIIGPAQQLREVMRRTMEDCSHGDRDSIFPVTVTPVFPIYICATVSCAKGPAILSRRYFTKTNEAISHLRNF